MLLTVDCEKIAVNGAPIVFCSQCEQMLIDNGTETTDGIVCSDCLKHYVKCCNCSNLWHENDTITDNENNIWCEDCYDEHFSDCAQCGETINNNDLIYIESTDEYVCESCYNDHYFHCNDCNDIYHKNNRYHTPNGLVCQTCFYENWCTCNSCGNVIANDDAFFTESGDGPYCESCYDSSYDDCDLIRDYSFKPTPVFHTVDKEKTNLFFGFELEIECQSGNRNENAKDIADIFDSFCYYKGDGSLNYGFEIVSRPLSWNFITSDRFQERLKDLEAYCKDNGIKSHDTSTCGFHIHASKNYFSTLHIYKLLSFVFNESNFYSLLLPISQRTECNFSRWSTVYDSQSIIDKARDKRTDNRYTALNLTRNTIEARIFRGNIRKDRILKNLEFYKAIIDYTMQAPIKTANDRHAFLSFVQKNKGQYANLDNFLVEKNLY